MQKNGKSTLDEIRKLVSNNQDIIEALKNLNRKLDPASAIRYPEPLSARASTALDPLNDSSHTDVLIPKNEKPFLKL